MTVELIHKETGKPFMCIARNIVAVDEVIDPVTLLAVGTRVVFDSDFAWIASDSYADVKTKVKNALHGINS